MSFKNASLDRCEVFCIRGIRGIGGNRWQSVAVGGNRWQSVAIGGISITVLRYEICYMRMTYATVDATDTPSPPELRLDM